MDTTDEQRDERTPGVPRSYIYCWRDYWDDLREGRASLSTLHRNHREMADIRAGDVVWAVTWKLGANRNVDDTRYSIVARHLVAEAGGTPPDDPEVGAGRWFFRSKGLGPSGRTSFDIDSQGNAEAVIRSAIRSLGFRADAEQLYSSLQSHGVRQISESASQNLARHVNFQFPASSTADDVPFDPANITDAREEIMRVIRARRGQQSFRDDLLTAYEGRCAITDCDVAHVLEAAHITPYLGSAANHVTNGLLLRTDLHTLLDCGLLAINPITREVILAPILRASADYKHLHGHCLRDPISPTAAPSTKALEALLKASGLML